MAQTVLAYLLVAAAAGWALRGWFLPPLRRAIAARRGEPLAAPAKSGGCEGCDCGKR